VRAYIQSNNLYYIYTCNHVSSRALRNAQHCTVSHESLYHQIREPFAGDRYRSTPVAMIYPVIYYFNRTEIRDVHAQSVSWKRNTRAVKLNIRCVFYIYYIIIFIYYLGAGNAGGDACALIQTRRVSFPI